MVAFRKVFPVLAIVAILLGTAMTADAQTPLRCFANAGVPPLLRAEGYTELTGDLLVQCTGGNPDQPFLANFQLFLNTNITSRLLTIGTTPVTEALLMIDEPSGTNSPTPFCVSPDPATNNNDVVGLPAGIVPAGAELVPSLSATTCPAGNPYAAGATYQRGTYTVFYGQRPVTGENAVVWQGIPVLPPGSSTRTFRFTNVRANAAGLGASQTLIPTQVVAFISVFPQNTLPIDNPQQTVGYVQQGMLFDTRACGGGDQSLVSVNQCQTVGTSGNTAQTFGLRFREGFATAFKTRLLPAQLTAPPGQVFNTESGFVRDTLLAPGVGVANSGTRLAARFVNVPAGVRIFVGTRDTVATGTAKAVLQTTDPAGTSGFAPGLGTDPFEVGGTTTISCGGSIPAIEVPLTAGSGLAVWEVTSAVVASSIDSITIPAAFAYTANVSAGQPALGTGQVIGNLAPFYAAGTAAERASATLPIPRFVARQEAVNIFRINQCQTNLLFPYVTNQAGFDTGIAIANTSQDPFSSPNERLQSGPCTIYYYGSLANGNPPVRASEQTDRPVNAGEVLTFILSGGGGYGLQGNPNFQGYIIAQCGFLYAHGFAFITDGPIGQANVAQGYLALVLDGADSNSLRGGTRAEVRGN